MAAKDDLIVVVGGGEAYYNIYDEDDMASDSASGLPTQQSVKAYVDSLTGEDPVFTNPQINDTTGDHQYVFAVNELAADRTVTLPLLTGNDTFVFNDFAATLTNKTLTSSPGVDVSSNALSTSSTARATLNGIASAGVTDGSVLRMGTSGSPLTDDQAGAGFVVGYFDSGATSGWPAGLFISTNVTGAGGSFTALQGDAVLTAAKATVTGIENWMQVNTGGRVTGACRSVQGTIDFSNEDKGSGGVYSAACFNIKGEGAACDIGTTQRVSCLELKTEGTFSSNAGENFETKAAGYAIYINGFTSAGGVTNILSSTSLAELPAGTLGLRVGVGGDADAGTAYYIPLVVATEWN